MPDFSVELTLYDCIFDIKQQYYDECPYDRGYNENVEIFPEFLAFNFSINWLKQDIRE